MTAMPPVTSAARSGVLAAILVCAAALAGTPAAGQPRDFASAMAPISRLYDRIGRPADVAVRVVRSGAGPVLGPALGMAISVSRDMARRLGTEPIPANMRALLECYFAPEILDAVQYRIGRPPGISVQALALGDGRGIAIALVDTVVFLNEPTSRSLWVWAHELGHVLQYRSWGISTFGSAYVRNHHAVEDGADMVAAEVLRRVLADDCLAGDDLVHDLVSAAAAVTL